MIDRLRRIIRWPVVAIFLLFVRKHWSMPYWFIKLYLKTLTDGELKLLIRNCRVALRGLENEAP